MVNEGWHDRLAKAIQGSADHSNLFSTDQEIELALAWVGRFRTADDSLSNRLIDISGGRRQAQTKLLELISLNLLQEPIQHGLLFGKYSATDNIQKKLKNRYLLLARIFHPDRNMADEKWVTKRMEVINNAYQQSLALPPETFHLIQSEAKPNIEDINTKWKESYGLHITDFIYTFHYSMLAFLDKIVGNYFRIAIYSFAGLVLSYFAVIGAGIILENYRLELESNPNPNPNPITSSHVNTDRLSLIKFDDTVSTKSKPEPTTTTISIAEETVVLQASKFTSKIAKRPDWGLQNKTVKPEKAISAAAKPLQQKAVIGSTSIVLSAQTRPLAKTQLEDKTIAAKYQRELQLTQTSINNTSQPLHEELASDLNKVDSKPVLLVDDNAGQQRLKSSIKHNDNIDIFSLDKDTWIIQTMSYRTRKEAENHVIHNQYAKFYVPIKENSKTKYVVIADTATTLRQARVIVSYLNSKRIGQPKIRSVRFLQENIVDD